VTDAEKKPPIPELNGAYTASELLLSPRLRLVAVGSVAMIFIVTVLLALPDEKSPQPLNEADVEQITRRVVIEQAEALRKKLRTLTERVAQLSKQISAQADKFHVLQGQHVGLETEVAALKSVDWIQALETANESWQVELKSLVGRIDTVETQLKQHAKDKAKTSLRKAKIAAPSFRVAAVEHWGDTRYVTLLVGRRLALLREGDTSQGWQFVGVDADNGDAVFANGKQTRKLRVRR